MLKSPIIITLRFLSNEEIIVLILSLNLVTLPEGGLYTTPVTISISPMLMVTNKDSIESVQSEIFSFTEKVRVS